MVMFVYGVAEHCLSRALNATYLLLCQPKDAVGIGEIVSTCILTIRSILCVLLHCVSRCTIRVFGKQVDDIASHDKNATGAVVLLE